MLLKVLLVSFVVLLIASISDFDFNKWVPVISLTLFLIFEVLFCWFHPIIGVSALVSLGIVILMASYEMDRKEAVAKHFGLFYIIMGIYGALFILQIVETFAGRLF